MDLRTGACDPHRPARVTRVRRLLELSETLINGIVLNREGRRATIVRKAFYELAGSVTPSVAVQYDGRWYYVHTRDRPVGRATFATGPYESNVMADALRILQQHGRTLRGRTFVDVGANIGTSTIEALSVFGARDGLAVEPEPKNFRLLRCNLVANDLDDRVRTVCAAASASSGTGRLTVSDWNSGDHRLGQDTLRAGQANRGEHSIEVPLRRLDDLIVEAGIDLDDIGVVWIDAQGHEGHILKGAPALLRSGVPVIAEYWPYQLRRTGGLQLLHSLIAEHYDLVIDVRDQSGGKANVLAAIDVHELEARYPAPKATATDIILLKKAP